MFMIMIAEGCEPLFKELLLKEVQVNHVSACFAEIGISIADEQALMDYERVLYFELAQGYITHKSKDLYRKVPFILRGLITRNGNRTVPPPTIKGAIKRLTDLGLEYLIDGGGVSPRDTYQ